MFQSANLSLLFKRIELRDTLSDEERAILEAAVDRTFLVSAKQDIVREGDRPMQSTVLLSGLVTRYRMLPHGGRQITAIHVPGDFIDLQSFPLKLMDHSLGALTDCILATMPHTALTQITETQPHLTRILWKLSLLDSALHREWIVAMGGMPSISHLAHLFCEIYLRLKAVGLAEGNSFQFAVTQQELADTLGISPVHVNRVMQELRAQAVIQFDGKIGTILDWHRLVEIGQFDDKHLHFHDG
jgi:CRP-like cAMP-binding protein